MNGIAKSLACGLDVRTETKVEQIYLEGCGWRVATEKGDLQADALILTAPAPQSMALCQTFMDQLSLEVPLILESIAFDPCLALMAVLQEGGSLVPEPGYVRPASGPVAWIADNTQKGISAGPPALTIHADAEFSRLHWDADRSVMERLLLEAARPYWQGAVVETSVQGWRYSQPIASHTEPCLYSRRPAPLAFAGDAFGGPRVEGAFLSGLAAANIVRNG